MKQIIHFDTPHAWGATTLKDKKRPEQNNMALHVCIDPQAVMENRKALAEEIQVPLDHWVLPWQKHTANYREVTSKDLGKGAFDKDTSILNVDGLYTTEKDILIGVFTADCVGLILVDETTPCLAVVHSGWKGSTQGIVYHMAKDLIDKGLLHPKTTKAYFSPSILFDSLEVGMEVVELFMANHIDLEGCIRLMPHDKAYIDNQGINIKMLQSLGITHIFPSSMDTKKNRTDCFSFRNHKQTGEHFTYGVLR